MSSISLRVASKTTGTVGSLTEYAELCQKSLASRNKETSRRNWLKNGPVYEQICSNLKQVFLESYSNDFDRPIRMSPEDDIICFQGKLTTNQFQL